MSSDKGFMSEVGGAHADTEGFGLIGAGNYAAVVVGKYHHGPVCQVRPEKTLAGNIEIIAVYETEYFFAVKLFHRFSR
jgi:hypothetical protein